MLHLFIRKYGLTFTQKKSKLCHWELSHCAIDTGDKLQLTTPTHGSLTTLLHSARLPIETPSHLFFSCILANSFWKEIAHSFEIMTLLTYTLIGHPLTDGKRAMWMHLIRAFFVEHLNETEQSSLQWKRKRLW